MRIEKIIFVLFLYLLLFEEVTVINIFNIKQIKSVSIHHHCNYFTTSACTSEGLIHSVA